MRLKRNELYVMYIGTLFVHIWSSMVAEMFMTYW